MDPEFITYQKFNDIALANELATLLTSHHIKYFLQEEAQSFDPTFLYADNKEYTIRIQPDDFEKVNDLLKQAVDESIAEVDESYYLLSFTDEELVDVIYKADEWNVFDVQLARKLLADRGYEMSDERVAEITQQRIEVLRKTESSQTTPIGAGYIFALAGGVLGFFIGWHLWTYKKTLPNGERVFMYNENDRQHGKIIFYLSFAGLAVGLAVKLSPLF